MIAIGQVLCNIPVFPFGFTGPSVLCIWEMVIRCTMNIIWYVIWSLPFRLVLYIRQNCNTVTWTAYRLIHEEWCLMLFQHGQMFLKNKTIFISSCLWNHFGSGPGDRHDKCFHDTFRWYLGSLQHALIIYGVLVGSPHETMRHLTHLQYVVTRWFTSKKVILLKVKASIIHNGGLLMGRLGFMRITYTTCSLHIQGWRRGHDVQRHRKILVLYKRYHETSLTSTYFTLTICNC